MTPEQVSTAQNPSNEDSQFTLAPSCSFKIAVREEERLKQMAEHKRRLDQIKKERAERLQARDAGREAGGSNGDKDRERDRERDRRDRDRDRDRRDSRRRRDGSRSSRDRGGRRRY